MMEVTLDVELYEFERKFAEFMVYSTRSVEVEFRAQCKGLMDTILYITPPANGKRARGKAREVGRRRIGWDLAGGGGWRGKRTAGVFTVLRDDVIASALETGLYESSDNVRLWVSADGTVYGTQRHFFRPNASMSEMRAHHLRYFKSGRMSRAGSYTRDIGRWRWIDNMVVSSSTFNRYLGQQQRKVGLYAAGFRPAAEGVGLGVPRYMKGHPAIGAFELRITDKAMQMRALNAVGYGFDRDLQRRIQWAVDQQVRKMERQLPNMIRAAARRMDG